MRATRPRSYGPDDGVALGVSDEERVALGVVAEPQEGCGWRNRTVAGREVHPDEVAVDVVAEADRRATRPGPRRCSRPYTPETIVRERRHVAVGVRHGLRVSSRIEVGERRLQQGAAASIEAALDGVAKARSPASGAPVAVVADLRAIGGCGTADRSKAPKRVVAVSHFTARARRRRRPTRRVSSPLDAPRNAVRGGLVRGRCVKGVWTLRRGVIVVDHDVVEPGREERRRLVHLERALKLGMPDVLSKPRVAVVAGEDPDAGACWVVDPSLHHAAGSAVAGIVFVTGEPRRRWGAVRCRYSAPAIHGKPARRRLERRGAERERDARRTGPRNGDDAALDGTKHGRVVHSVAHRGHQHITGSVA